MAVVTDVYWPQTAGQRSQSRVWVGLLEPEGLHKHSLVPSFP